MLTPGTTAPVESVTVPTIVAVVWARHAAEANTIKRDRSRLFLSRMLPSPSGLELPQDSTDGSEVSPGTRRRER